MRTTLTSLAILLALGACGQTDNPRTGTESASTETFTAEQIAAETALLNEWFEAKYSEQLAFSPIAQTFQGIKDSYSEIDDVSEAAEIAQHEWLRGTVEEMKQTFNYDKLTAEAKTSWDIWEYQYDQAEAGVPFRNHGYIFEQMGGPQAFFATFLISFHGVETDEEMEAYISRLGGLAQATDELVARTKLRAANSIRPPKFAYEGVIDQTTKIITGAPFTDGEDSALWADAQRKIEVLVDAETIDETRADELRAATRSALTDTFGPSYQALLDFMVSDMPNADEIATGVGKLPDGKPYYNYMLSSSTTTDMTAEEVHQLGLSEVARIRAEMVALKDQVGFEGDLQAFFAMIRDTKDDERFYFPDTDEGRVAYIDEAQVKLDFIEARLPEYFGILPKAALVVKRVEEFREQDGAAQHYYPGTPDGERPGIYYAHLSDMTAMPRNQLEVIAYHEGLPGHHMQISIAQELESVPTFRTQAGFTAYIEGWALYSELLAKEMGAYEGDAYADFGRLTTEMWRAVRLVVDTGLHSKGWTEAEAIEYFSSNTPEPLESVRSEVRRYIVWPGQATSYKIGMLKILELRAYAKAELGEDFDIRAFHDTVLGGGALPLALLERRVKDWVAAEKAG
ncbi:MAG: DUF885 domain-containing protein [Hyphomonadaceae bacterium]